MNRKSCRKLSSYRNDDYVGKDIYPIYDRRPTWVPEYSVATNDFNNKKECEWKYGYLDEHHSFEKWVTKNTMTGFIRR